MDSHIESFLSFLREKERETRKRERETRGGREREERTDSEKLFFSIRLWRLGEAETFLYHMSISPFIDLIRRPRSASAWTV